MVRGLTSASKVRRSEGATHMPPPGFRTSSCCTTNWLGAVDLGSVGADGADGADEFMSKGLEYRV